MRVTLRLMTWLPLYLQVGVAVSLFRCSVEFGGVAGWSCEVKIRKLLWSDRCFNFRFQLTFWVGRFVIVLRFCDRL
ncbi:hypothetical protein LINPERHAP1_LOCUS16647 [Linum perenne]